MSWYWTGNQFPSFARFLFTIGVVMADPDDLVPEREAAKLLGVALGQIENRIRRGLLKQYSRVESGQAPFPDRLVWLVSISQCLKVFRIKDVQMVVQSESEISRTELDRMPIGSDEILLVGDVRLGVRLLRAVDGDMAQAERHLRAKSQAAAEFLIWSRNDVVCAMQTLLAVRAMVDLVIEGLGLPPLGPAGAGVAG